MDIEFDAVRSPLVECKPIPQQLKDYDITLTWAIFNQPFFAHLLMAELPLFWTKDVPIAATDGFYIFLNPDPFFVYDLQERAFILFHEVLHCVFGDCILNQAWLQAGQLHVGGEVLPYGPELMNVAADYVINAVLIEGKAGKFNPEWLYDRAITPDGNRAAVDIYAQLYKEAIAGFGKGKGAGGKGMPGKGGIPIPVPPSVTGKRFDKHLAPGAKDGKDPSEAVKERNDAKFKAAIQSAATVAEQQGKLPSTLKRLIHDVLNPKVPWQEHLRSALNRANGAEGLDWRYADKRMIARDYVGHSPVYFARASGHSAGTIVIAVDTSGSIGQKELDSFFAEMTGILNDLSPERVVIMQCDADVGAVDEITDLSELDEWRVKGLIGGGGTDFCPVFKEVAKRGIQPDALVYLTDLFGTFPKKEVGYPVIWGVIGECTNAPFGEIVSIN